MYACVNRSVFMFLKYLKWCKPINQLKYYETAEQDDKRIHKRRVTTLLKQIEVYLQNIISYQDRIHADVDEGGSGPKVLDVDDQVHEREQEESHSGQCENERKRPETIEEFFTICFKSLLHFIFISIS